MSSASFRHLDLSPEPDLHPLYPTQSHIARLLSRDSGLDPAQKANLVSHCLSRACTFGDLALLSYLLTDSQAQPYLDLGTHDDDGLGLISRTIQGFGSETDHDVEREECVRLLIAQGADVSGADHAGWTPLHHAAILCPPTLVSHLMTHGCSPFDETRRQLTPLDIVTAHTVMPGREDIALLLEAAMRGEGWTGGRMEERRRVLDERLKRKGKRKIIQENVSKILGVQPQWWKTEDSANSSTDSGSDDDEDDEMLYTPARDYTTMLAWSPQELPYILDSIIGQFKMSPQNVQPANTLYLMARFACLTCDHTWLEDLTLGAIEAIEDKFFTQPEDITCLLFWLRNSTVWLHLMRCDNDINEALEMLGTFELVEQVINAIFVFVIRYAERRIDQLLDAAMLDNSPLSSEFESIQFESEWSFLRPFSAKKKTSTNNTPNSSNTPFRNGTPSSPPFLPSRPPSPSIPLLSPPPTTPKSFSSLRQSVTKAKTPTTPVYSLFQETPQTPGLLDLTSFMTALHTLLIFSEINPGFIAQFWSQVMYWTTCEIFNRILARKKLLCRSKAVQIGANLSMLEEWIEHMNLPLGIATHFLAVHDLLNWLQRLSSITDFSNLVETIQSMKSINPLQMRRAVRDYRYEVNEGRMTDECVQYLTQLQKDWERHRVKAGVEAIRKGMGDRDRERELDDVMNSDDPSVMKSPSISMNSQLSITQHHLDLLFDRDQDQSLWEPPKAPQALGELLDSRFMLQLSLPSDPHMLSASPSKSTITEDTKGRLSGHPNDARIDHRNIHGTAKGAMKWKSRSRKVREVEVETLQWVDRVRYTVRWARPLPTEDEDVEDTDARESSHTSDEIRDLRIDTDVPPTKSHATPLTRKPSSRSKRLSVAGELITPVTSPHSSIPFDAY
ncbi:DIL domain-containing protein [Hygrophoropsis aurantiaca]|uniref:DIL domain-containing protein n=1 Tax=Hygrophoropsis aurantiaca TaxID=72124 RepID=A0ACB8ACQ6_9AGAM|nr:DIL domain-containing protein [Hygrophoropsis aurantiaca]